MITPERPHEEYKEQREKVERKKEPSIQKQEENIIKSALTSISEVPQKPPENAEQLPSAEEQLGRIVELGTLLRRYAPTNQKKIELWGKYVDCINDFRDAYAKLPPIEKIASTYAFRINDAMNRGDTQALLKIFQEEKQEYSKPPFYKRIPGLNFLFGVLGGGGELASNIAELSKYGVQAAMGQEQAREVLAKVGRSFLELDKVAAALLRSEEYRKSIAEEGGVTTGYVLGKHAFDLASALLSGGGGIFTKGAKVAGHGAKETGHIASHLAGETALHAAAHMAAHETTEKTPKKKTG